MGADRALGSLLLMLSVAEIVVGQADTTVGYGQKCDMPCNPSESCGNSTRQECDTKQHLQCMAEKNQNQTCRCKGKYFTPDRSQCISETSLDKELTFQFDFRPHLTLNVRLSTTYRNVKIGRLQDCATCQTTQHTGGGYAFNLGNRTVPYNVSLTITDAHGGTFPRNFSVSPVIADNFNETVRGPGHVILTWGLDYPAGRVNIAQCLLEETQKKIDIGSCTNVSCELTNLKQDTQYTLHIMCSYNTSEIKEIVTTYVYPLKYKRTPEAVIDSAKWTTGPFSANVTVTEKAGGVVGAYVINITSVKQGSSRCVQFHRNNACDEVDGRGCEKSNALVELDPAPSPGTTIQSTTTTTTNTSTNSSKDDERINRVTMRLDLHPSTEYKVSVTPWYCNVTHVQANSTEDTISTKHIEAVIDSAKWTTGSFSANVTITEKAGDVVGAYVIKTTSVKQGSSRCVQFRRNNTCDEVVGLNCTKGAALDINSTNNNSTNLFRMRLDLQPSTEYKVSVTPYYCNVTHVQANSSEDTITTNLIATGNVSIVHPADKKNVTVTVTWLIQENPPNGAMVNYRVTMKDVVGKHPHTGTCISANVDPLEFCFFMHAGSGNFSCSRPAEDLYGFWEYEVNVTASYENVTTTLTSLRFETNPGVPGNATELVNCSNGKLCVSWKDPCPRDRRGFIDHYELQLTLEGQNQIIMKKNQTSQFQEYISSNNTKGYRRDNNREPYSESVNDGIQPGKSYTFKITSYTPDHVAGLTVESPPIPIPITESPKVPTTEAELENLIPESRVSADERSLSFVMTNTSFLTNNDNGEVTKKGMIVVKNSEFVKFHDNATAPALFDTLLKGNQPNNGTYRVDFSRNEDLSAVAGEAKVTLGDNDPICDSKAQFCDPPLDPGTSYTVYVFSCNAVLCAKIPAVKNKKTGGSKHEHKNTNNPVIGPEIIGVLVLGVTAWVAIAFLAYFMCFRKRRQRPISELDSGSGGIFYAMRPRNTRPMLLLDLETVVAKKQRDEGLLLREEYDEVKNGDVNYPTDASLLDTNKPKNRFGDVMAFDHTRVKLSADSQGGDYINANYIPGYSRENEYIATQGPLHSTMDDFWRMVWEHRASIIVMLTQTVERGQVKCEMYWPATHGEVRQYGDVIVTNTSVSNLNEFTITIFTLRHAADEKQELEVMHFHYLKWPDMTADVHVKSMTHFVSFVRQYVKPNRSCPMVVHCSAGIGRTGTYISIDYVMQFTQERPINDHLDIFSFIVKIRKARCRMVQTAGQYILIHQCARHLMAARRRRDLELKEGSSGSGTPHPVANGESPPPLVNNRAKAEKVAAARGDRGEGTDSADELSQNDTVEMETALYENLMAGAPSDARLDTLRQEDEATPDNPLATSSMEQLYRP